MTDLHCGVPECDVWLDKEIIPPRDVSTGDNGTNGTGGLYRTNWKIAQRRNWMYT